MFIKKINVDNFGKLSDININPANGLNIIYAPNESGKTTLLSFIKYIFYGTKQKKNYGDITFKERYTPWNGMPLKGSLEFENEEGNYLIERSDAERSSKLSVTDLTNAEKIKLSGNPGVDFIGLGEKAFTDLSFVYNLSSISDSQTDGELVSKFSYSESESNTYLSIRDRLTEKLNNLISTKRKSSALFQFDEKINDRRQKLRHINNSISEIQNKIHEIELNEKIAAQLKEENHILMLQKAEKIKNTLLKKKNELSCERDVCANNKSSVLTVISICCAVITGLISIKYPMFIYLSIGSFMICFFNFIKEKQLKKELKKAMNRKNGFLSIQIEDIEQKLMNIQKILDNKEKMSNTDIAYINSFTNSVIDDIILKNEERILNITTDLNRNFHLKELQSSLNDDLYDITTEIYALESEKLTVNTEADIINKALEILDNAYTVAKGSFFPDISKNVLKLYSMITDDSIDSVITDDDFNMNIVKSGHIHSSKFLSTGAGDALYFSLRIAILKRASDMGASIPLFLDDILSNCDDNRAYRILDIIYSLSKENQIFLCTCRSREGEYFKNKSDVNIISL